MCKDDLVFWDYVEFCQHRQLGKNAPLLTFNFLLWSRLHCVMDFKKEIKGLAIEVMDHNKGREDGAQDFRNNHCGKIVLFKFVKANCGNLLDYLCLKKRASLQELQGNGLHGQVWVSYSSDLASSIILSFSIYFQWEGLMGLGHLLGI